MTPEQIRELAARVAATNFAIGPQIREMKKAANEAELIGDTMRKPSAEEIARRQSRLAEAQAREVLEPAENALNHANVIADQRLREIHTRGELTVSNLEKVAAEYGRDPQTEVRLMDAETASLRALDPIERAAKLQSAVRAAERAGADFMKASVDTRAGAIQALQRAKADALRTMTAARFLGDDRPESFDALANVLRHSFSPDTAREFRDLVRDAAPLATVRGTVDKLHSELGGVATAYRERARAVAEGIEELTKLSGASMTDQGAADETFEIRGQQISERLEAAANESQQPQPQHARSLADVLATANSEGAE